MTNEALFLYGPPGAGKSTVGRLLAANLGLPFHDLDAEIERSQGCSISDIFNVVGESGFREVEGAALRSLQPGVTALGGGSLLNEENRRWAESRGNIVLLTAPLPVLRRRLEASQPVRPLLGGGIEKSLIRLLDQRHSHYASFKNQVHTGEMTPAQAAWEAQIAIGWFRLRAMGDYPVRVRAGGLGRVAEFLSTAVLASKVALITDETIAPLYASVVIDGLRRSGIGVSLFTIPTGEAQKTIRTVESVWNHLLAADMGRDGLVLALGGGVVSDLAGFSAATFLRGVRWAVLPTTLLAMADASLGGKTGIDLVQGKNLAGAFYPPSLVLADPHTLQTLPGREWRSGMAEIVKHAVIADAALFERCNTLASSTDEKSEPLLIVEILKRAIAVKVGIIERDPYENGEREALNFGHTIGHAVEAASNYNLLHGEAISIGMVLECQLAERIGLAALGLASQVEALLLSLGLPTRLPAGIDRAQLEQIMEHDKKRRNGKIRFSLPAVIGQVRTGITFDNIWRSDVFDPGAARAEFEPSG